ncbi:dihydrofolate reductase family protein [Actinopolymorpha alba]|uniref:dihydrofolate reductase family protein n=1 Tax=Actinopolymorpha alba TaxID=533267 RepID=UPI00037C9BF9|nr:dihydrofolate reductase family protein [Actinopolymorpha alba]
MAKVLLDMAMSLDGFIAGPNDEYGGLHDWFFGTGDDSASAIVKESIETTGAIVIGRRTYDIGDRDDGFAQTPYQVPHFVLTHRAPHKVAKGNLTLTFATSGLEAAIQEAKLVAGDRYVTIGGGADIAQQCIRAGLVDEIQLHVTHVLLGAGIRLLDLGTGRIDLARTRVIESRGATHLRFRVLK